MPKLRGELLGVVLGSTGGALDGRHQGQHNEGYLRIHISGECLLTHRAMWTNFADVGKFDPRRAGSVRGGSHERPPEMRLALARGECSNYRYVTMILPEEIGIVDDTDFQHANNK